ncbi:hypothetical protein A2154_04155 [Candidatus Gottesmanbacteria bacterium RBG_16_43_7]|uniref:Uncharacterized protein n=1 Tax=Candidatus Gottesmanbacteria bacterium RBG_16_43_7 TaxID=1798373 RepID=A0A1F5Z959_9BACT|nr:MAG: hypothetical protein A2154_04155 [Candidatus Gottesmanbacteria bacterium RBG_16_43_7]
MIGMSQIRYPLKKHSKIKKSTNYNWLPINSALIPDIFSFGRVRGIARFFLTIEMSLSVLVVAGTLLLMFMEIVK